LLITSKGKAERELKRGSEGNTPILGKGDSLRKGVEPAEGALIRWVSLGTGKGNLSCIPDTDEHNQRPEPARENFGGVFPNS